MVLPAFVCICAAQSPELGCVVPFALLIMCWEKKMKQRLVLLQHFELQVAKMACVMYNLS